MIEHGNVYTLQVKLAQHDKAVSTIYEILTMHVDTLIAEKSGHISIITNPNQKKS